MITFNVGTQIKKFDDGCVVIRLSNGLFTIPGSEDGIRPFAGGRFGWSDFASPSHIADVVHDLLCQNKERGWYKAK